MKSLRIFDGHLRYAVLAVTLVIAAVVPAFASAAQLTSRSAALSSSSKAATGVSYEFTFTAAATAAEAVVQFCSNSPLVGEFCTTPTGFTAAGATTGNSTGVTSVNSATASTVKITKAITAGVQTFTLGGITNPTDAGTIYARVLTYTASGSTAYDVQASTTNDIGSPVDQGSVAIAITDTVSVSGAVLEALTFCVSGGELTGTGLDCATGYSAPVLSLGEEVADDVFALNPNDVYEGNVYTKLSTNAVGGAVVSLKSSATCGGLALNGTGACNIAPSGAAGNVTNGDAKFGVKLTLPTVDAEEFGEIAASGSYDETNYRFNFVDNTAGVTSVYGDPIFNTAGGFADNLNTLLTFGASAAPNTPAGKYSTAISLIATGTF